MHFLCIGLQAGELQDVPDKTVHIVDAGLHVLRAGRALGLAQIVPVLRVGLKNGQRCLQLMGCGTGECHAALLILLMSLLQKIHQQKDDAKHNGPDGAQCNLI